MLTFMKLCGSARALAVALAFVVAGVSIGSARAIKTIDAIDSSETSLPSKAKVTPFRYFTINQVLAKYDRSSVVVPALRLASIYPSGTLTDVSVTSPIRSLPNDEPFGLSAFRAPAGLVGTKWRKVETEIRADIQVLVNCRANPEQCRSSAARRFQTIVDKARTQQGRARIAMINRSINAAINYMRDPGQHGMPDLWSSPLATFSSGRGDCEDYAIAKYVALLEAGEDADNLRLLIGREDISGQDHAVLGVRINGRWLVLDNRHPLLVDSAEAAHFVPSFAISGKNVKVLAASYNADAR